MLINNRIYVGLACFLVLTGCSVVTRDQVGSRSVSLCEITSHPKQYDGRIVRVYGEVQASPETGVIISSLHCKRGMVVSNIDSQQPENMIYLRRSIFTDGFPEERPKISVDALGKVMYDDKRPGVSFIWFTILSIHLVNK